MTNFCPLAYPNTLLRVTYHDMVQFDDHDMLLSHYFVQHGRSGLYDSMSIPLSSISDWSTVARVLVYPNDFQILRIDARKVKKLSRRPHTLLEDGEFFANVPRAAIQAQISYKWKADEPEAKDIPQEWSQWLARSSGFSPVVFFA